MKPCLFRPLVSLAVILIALATAALVPSAEPPPSADADLQAELPRVPPVEPADALATFVVQPGFRMSQVAAEPLVTDPVALSFDADGRLYVVEMMDYSEQADDNLGVIRRLTDTDGDGRFDSSDLFAEKLSWPTAVICYDGGVFVAAAPDVLFLKDTNGDGRADVVKKIFTGFGRSNVQGLVNSFAWGLDNRIHGATSSSGGNVRPADQPQAKPVALSGRDFSFDPRTLELRAESGGAQHGMSFDNWGHKFVCSNSDHIQQVMFDDRYIARNPFLSAPSARLSIAADGAQAEVYRVSPVEPWRIVRTRLRVAGAVPGPIEGGGRASGYFTSATGVTIYRGNAWPANAVARAEDVTDIAIVGDVGSNLVHRKRLEPHGLEFIARRIDDQSEFVASKDLWFRPVQYANAPDGTLYIADMYREVIEHPQSLPPVIKQHLDLTSGRDRGRIYRVEPEGFVQPALRKLSKASSADLVELLAHANGWHRDTAARLLYERQDREILPALIKLATQSPSALGRLHALYTLEGLEALSFKPLLAGLADADPRVRRHAVRLAENGINESEVVRAKLFAMAGDEANLEVRYQLAFSLGEIDDAGRDKALANLARGGSLDRWMRLALLSSLSRGVATVFSDLANDRVFRDGDDGQRLLAALAEQMGVANHKGDARAVLAIVDALPAEESDLAEELVLALSGGLSRQRGSLDKLIAGDSTGKAADIFARLLAHARDTARDASRPGAERAQAVAVLALGPASDTLALVESLIDSRHPQEVQLAALTALGKRSEPEVATFLIEAWPQLSPRLRSQAAEALFARVDRIALLLGGIEQGKFKAADLDPARVKQLLSHSDPKLRSQAARVLADVKLGRRQEVVDAYRDVLALKGDPLQGKKHFQKVCAACHRVDGVGYEIGANLATMKNRGPESILVNVLDPNREVNPQYVNYALTTTDGRAITGMVDAETANSVTLKRAEGASDTVLRVDIEQLTASGLSIMPEGLEQQLDKQALADLIAYLMSVK